MTTHFFGETAVLTGRSLRHILRSPDTIITTVITPVAIMLLFVYVFGGAINIGSDSYVNYLLPGILLITIGSGISYTSLRLFLDMQSGIFERFQSMPIARSSVLWAHVLTSLAANLISVVAVVLVALLMGFRSGAGVEVWLAVAGILILFTLALTWIAVIVGLSAKTVDGASAFAYPLIFLPFISSAFVLTETMPGPVRVFAENQPVTSIVNAIRDLFTQRGSAPTSGSPSPGASASSSSRTYSPCAPTAAGSPSVRSGGDESPVAERHAEPVPRRGVVATRRYSCAEPAGCFATPVSQFKWAPAHKHPHLHEAR